MQQAHRWFICANQMQLPRTRKQGEGVLVNLGTTQLAMAERRVSSIPRFLARAIAEASVQQTSPCQPQSDEQLCAGVMISVIDVHGHDQVGLNRRGSLAWTAEILSQVAVHVSRSVGAAPFACPAPKGWRPFTSRRPVGRVARPRARPRPDRRAVPPIRWISSPRFAVMERSQAGALTTSRTTSGLHRHRARPVPRLSQAFVRFPLPKLGRLRVLAGRNWSVSTSRRSSPSARMIRVCR